MNRDTFVLFGDIVPNLTGGTMNMLLSVLVRPMLEPTIFFVRQFVTVMLTFMMEILNEASERQE